MNKERVAIVTLGCDKNRVDSEIMAGTLFDVGYEITVNEEEADFIIINTCTFIEEARRETEEAIEKALSYDKAKVVISGCHVQRFQKELEVKFPKVWGFLDINSIEEIDKVLSKIKEGKRVESFRPPTFLYSRYNKRFVSTFGGSAYIKIGEGCNHNCTFCIIPKVKGRARSRKIEDVVNEARYLNLHYNIKEIILIAQDLNSYGLDIYGRPMLAELVKRLTEVEGIEWIRLLYMYPFDFPYEILDVMRFEEKLCKYIDIPLQHISNNILRKMGRKGTKEEIYKLLYKIREKIPEISLRTTFIVGFPGETEEDFYELKEFMEEIKFHWVGIFPYSREEGTYAYTLKEQIPEEIKKQRWRSLMASQKKITSNINKKRIGNIEDVLIEENRNGIFLARSQREAPEIDGRIVVYKAKDRDIGEIRKIQIISSSDYDLSGVLI